jgi:hypothetical protein
MTDPKDSKDPSDSNDSKKDQKDYEIGRGKPPKATQFKKGQSGNSKGRPKGSKNLKTIWSHQLSETVPVVQQGKKRKIQKQEAIVTQVINQAASGNLKAIAMVLQHDRQFQGAIDSIALMPILKPTDEKVQASFLDRMRESVRTEFEHEQAIQSKKINLSKGEPS